MLAARQRFTQFRRNDLERLVSEANVFTGSSADLIQSAWTDLANLSDNDEDWGIIPPIPNLCFVVFTRESPTTSELQPSFTHVRIINPLEENGPIFGEWQLLRQ